MDAQADHASHARRDTLVHPLPLMTILSPSSSQRNPLHSANSLHSLTAASSVTIGGDGSSPEEYATAQSSLHSLTDSSLDSNSARNSTRNGPQAPLGLRPSFNKRDAVIQQKRSATLVQVQAREGEQAAGPPSSSSTMSSFASSSSFGAASDASIPRPVGARHAPVPLSSGPSTEPLDEHEEKENHPSSSPVRRVSRAAPPFPRPQSPLPALPSSSTTRSIRAPPRPSASSSSGPFPNSLTSHTSFAAFKATNPRPTAPSSVAAGRTKRASMGGSGSEDTHRTSSEVDLDFSFEYDPRKDVSMSREMGLLDDALVEEALAAEQHAEGEEAELEREETVVFAGRGSSSRHADHTAIPVYPSLTFSSTSSVRPAAHDIPESALVRSDSGKLVGLKHERAASAMDLRAQFKADALEVAARERAEVAIPMMVEDAYGGEVPLEEDSHRRWVREGKRPAEGERAASTTVWMGDAPPLVPPVDSATSPPSKASKRISIGRGFAYNPTPLDPHLPLAYGGAPRSAPAKFQTTFSAQQEQPPLHALVEDEAKRSTTRGVFPLPLKLLADRTKRTATALVSPALSAAASWRHGRDTPTGAAEETDAESIGPSPLFDDQEEFVDGTVRTAPSTPNDTPLMQECFDEDETAHPPRDLPPPVPVPVPHRLGTYAAPVGLGFDFGDGRGVDEFPVIPLRQSRRISLPPEVVRRRQSLRLSQYGYQAIAIPSVAVSPPPVERPSQDSTESSSSLATTAESSADSAVDPTVSPTRRISRRLSSNSSSQPRPISTVRFNPAPLPSSSPVTHTHADLDTPSHDRFTGPSVRTPQHLLATPSTAGGAKRNLSRSFSFSPAPLRLVKAQLLRAAGYSVPPPAAADAGPPPALGPAVVQREDSDRAIELDRADGDSRVASPVVGGAATRRRTAVWDDLTDLLSSSPAAWLDEVVPAKLAFIAGFLLGPWLWVIAGWWLRPLDGELPSTRGKRCRDPTCGCGRMLRGSALREHTSASSAYSREKARLLNPKEVEMWAGLDRWVFLNRVAAGGGAVGVSVIVAVAIWAAVTA
ncbi:hypothetical protein JCM11251_000535 [Rhodosporidiobolus azoricus]